jgi:hypothetical protein
MQCLVIDGLRVFHDAQPDRRIRTGATVRYIRTCREATQLLWQLRTESDNIGELWLGSSLADGGHITEIVDLLLEWAKRTPLGIDRIYVVADPATTADLRDRLAVAYASRHVPQIDPQAYLGFPETIAQAA